MSEEPLEVKQISSPEEESAWEKEKERKGLGRTLTDETLTRAEELAKSEATIGEAVQLLVEALRERGDQVDALQRELQAKRTKPEMVRHVERRGAGKEFVRYVPAVEKEAVIEQRPVLMAEDIVQGALEMARTQIKEGANYSKEDLVNFQGEALKRVAPFLMEAAMARSTKLADPEKILTQVLREAKPQLIGPAVETKVDVLHAAKEAVLGQRESLGLQAGDIEEAYRATVLNLMVVSQLRSRDIGAEMTSKFPLEAEEQEVLAASRIVEGHIMEVLSNAQPEASEAELEVARGAMEDLCNALVIRAFRPVLRGRMITFEQADIRRPVVNALAEVHKTAEERASEEDEAVIARLMEKSKVETGGGNPFGWLRQSKTIAEGLHLSKEELEGKYWERLKEAATDAAAFALRESGVLRREDEKAMVVQEIGDLFRTPVERGKWSLLHQTTRVVARSSSDLKLPRSVRMNEVMSMIEGAVASYEVAEDAMCRRAKEKNPAKIPLDIKKEYPLLSGVGEAGRFGSRAKNTLEELTGLNKEMSKGKKANQAETKGRKENLIFLVAEMANSLVSMSPTEAVKLYPADRIKRIFLVGEEEAKKKEQEEQKKQPERFRRVQLKAVPA